MKLRRLSTGQWEAGNGFGLWESGATKEEAAANLKAMEQKLAAALRLIGQPPTDSIFQHPPVLLTHSCPPESSDQPAEKPRA